MRHLTFLTSTAALLTASATLLSAQPQRTNPLVFENDQVRVLKVSDPPHRKGRLHEHAMNRVMVYLNAGHLVLEYEGGKSDDQKVKAGEVRWSAAGGKHTSENVGDRPLEIVEIELKSKPGGETKPITAALDPLTVEPAHYSILFENDQVRAVRVKLDPHGKFKQHEHTVNRVLVFLTDVSAKVTAADGIESQLKQKAGDTVFSGPAKHAEENLLPTAGEVVMVELKK